MSSAKSVKTIRKVERPRPLKSSTETASREPLRVIDAPVTKKTDTDFLTNLESLYINLNNSNYDDNTAREIAHVCDVLRSIGQELDSNMKGLLDHYFVTFRNAAREDRLDVVSRLRLLEIIEIKAMRWKTNENITDYYRRKIMELEGTDKGTITPSLIQNYSPLLPSPTQPSPTMISVPLAPGEILRSSGKFAKPTKISGKNIYKDEVVIRNSDSGKVNPGARDRLVQITGPNEEAISHAKVLVEDTIRRNASPMRDKIGVGVLENSELTRRMSLADEEPAFSKKQLMHSFSMGDASLGEYTYEVTVGSDIVKLSGHNSFVLQEAKRVLMKYFTGQLALEKEYQPVMETSALNFENVIMHRPKTLLQRSSIASSGGSIGSSSPLDTTSSEDESLKNGGHNFSTSSIGMDTKFPYPEMSRIHTTHLPNFVPTDDDSSPPIPPPEPRLFKYTKDELLKYSKSPLCNNVPQLNPEATEFFPHIFGNGTSVQRKSPSNGESTEKS